MIGNLLINEKWDSTNYDQCQEIQFPLDDREVSEYLTMSRSLTICKVENVKDITASE